MFPCDASDVQGQLRSGREGIVPGVHGCRAGVRFLAVESDGVALYSLGAQHHSQGQTQGFEHGPLFDVEFQIGGRVGLLRPRFREAVDLHAAAQQSGFQGDAVFVLTDTVCRDGIRACKRRRAQQASAETRAFFVRPVHYANGDGRAAVELFSKAPQDFEAAEHAQRAIQPAAIGHGIEMPADH